MFLRSFRERMSDLLFYVKFHDLSYIKNAKHGREAQFENKKCENTLRIPLLLKNPIGFFLVELVKSLKNHRDFNQKWISGMLDFAMWFLGRLYARRRGVKKCL